MKKIVLIISFLFGSIALNSQQLNKEGQYMNTEGDLFSGKVTSVKDGVRSELEVKEGMLNGEANYFYASGNKMEAGQFKNGLKEDKWTRYSDNGSISAVGFYLGGKKNGTWLVYDEKGNKRFEMNYSAGEKTGTWTNWNENGMVLNTKNYTSAN
jgi:antitoxin component YwqK of YwqJK toxin-antitoxin module